MLWSPQLCRGPQIVFNLRGLLESVKGEERSRGPIECSKTIKVNPPWDDLKSLSNTILVIFTNITWHLVYFKTWEEAIATAANFSYHRRGQYHYGRDHHFQRYHFHYRLHHLHHQHDHKLCSKTIKLFPPGALNQSVRKLFHKIITPSISSTILETWYMMLIIIIIIIEKIRSWKLIKHEWWHSV